MTTPPNPSNKLKALFDMEGDVSVEINPLNLRKKRGQDKSDTLRSSILIQHRRSTRNPRIGSGFNNKPDNPIEIVDEDA